jgi:fucose 4-O-acetylase-like acetyltransferase
VTTGDRVRITWIDQAKGIGIFLVVLGHTLRGLKASQIIPDSRAFRLTDSWIYSFHMPLFFLLSGLFAERRIDRGARAFVRDKLATLAYPYLVWSVLQTLAQFATSRYANHRPSLSDLGWILIEPILQFWFLYALFLISLFYYALRRCGLGPPGVLAAFTASWATRGWIPYLGWWPLNASRNNGIYYALGSALNRLGWTERLEQAPSPAMISTAILGYGVVAASASRALEGPPLLGLAVTLCGIAASVALAVLLGRANGADFIRVMGVSSLEIYVAHTIASAGTRVVLKEVLRVRDGAAHVLLGTIGGIVLPLVLARLCRRYHADFLFRFPRQPAAK